MLNYRITMDETGKKWLETSISGKALLSIPTLNKGTAFTDQERQAFGLLGKLPDCVEDLDTQVARVYQQFLSYDKPINRNRYLNRLLDYNQTLFYELLRRHTSEMLPVIYTPFVGSNVKLYNMRFMQPRGLYISYKNQDKMEKILDNRTNPHIKLIVVTDGEAILGIGDQGVGGMAIPVAKLIVYSLFAGIDPNTTLPIMLDVGTNNEVILKDPLYLGWRHRRIDSASYQVFMDRFIHVVKKKFPGVFLHYEDFGRNNGTHFLKKYRHELCSFNDDIQGTGIVALAAVLAACRKTKTKLHEQRIVIFGGGSAGMGVAENIYSALLAAGIQEKTAKHCFWIVDRFGLVTDRCSEITDAQQPFARNFAEISSWNVENAASISLLEVIQNVKPTILIGTSAQTGAFTQTMITEMANHVAEPTILPLSNPNERAEATPEEIIHWTKGRALIATGSPFADVQYNNQTFVISQCNNYLAFPGLGLGITAIGASFCSDSMLRAASHALAEFANQHCDGLLPTIPQVEAASLHIAIAVAKAGVDEGYATIKIDKPVEEFIAEARWKPGYLPYVYSESQR
ncbi:MAG: NAD-dependent malic enzyme [Coxiella sp. RIFCSPHIGHO2_12_FULL_42_15]|nr:MAG: NAD-dependent malic enzyme [Coxiella sp. RIFCSPHIGHO2_12_FULL_42_15]